MRANVCLRHTTVKPQGVVLGFSKVSVGLMSQRNRERGEKQRPGATSAFGWFPIAHLASSGCNGDISTARTNDHAFSLETHLQSGIQEVSQ